MVDIVLAALVLVAAFVSLFVGFLVGRVLTERSLEIEFREREAEVRKDSVARSRSTLSGRFLEQLAPHFPDFPYDPTDLRFLGTPVDYIVFDGLAEGEVTEVVFLEVKSGGSTLSGAQRRLRDAVEAGAVRWEVYRLPAD
ncbi:MAG TPA: Holliday junction resolvase-like protein [Thermoplasmata archaeon]|nr:Holliday junction resolvase-like protein [Thermoplasmata archaeon]